MRHRWPRLGRLLRFVLLPGLLAVGLIAVACGGDAPDGDPDAAQPEPSASSGTAAEPSDDAGLPLVVTTVSPLRSIVVNVGGDRVRVEGIVPEGTNSHTFEPPPSAAAQMANADLVIINGLNLEEPTKELAQTNVRAGVAILELGNAAISPDEYIFDFSFPENEGNPNPHLWTAPNMAIAYAEIVRDALAEIDPEGADYFTANLAAFRTRLEAMDEAFMTATATIPEANRKLLTYHDSFPFFGPRYGFEIIGAIQPSDFSEPSPREVADIVRQIREAGVPAIFGSEVFPSEVLDTIASEAGAVQVSTLRDDDLPGEPGDPENTYMAMMVENVRTMVAALGGDASALDGFDVSDTWTPSE